MPLLKCSGRDHITDLNEWSRHLVIIVALGQSVFRNLFKNADEANDEVLVRVRIVVYEVIERAKSSTHDARVVIAKSFSEIREKVRNGGRRFVVESV